MKQIKDIFEIHDKWGIGLDCCECKHCSNPRKGGCWPTNDFQCNLHNISLNIELKENGFLNGEYFCKNFEDLNAFPPAVEEFSTIKDELEDNVLYEACGKEYLLAIPFKELP